LRDALARRYAREVNMTSRVDPGLVGGAVIRAGDTVVDGSLRGRLARLAETLQRA
jgi:F-type H+-transporting ATPase subunit delta